MSNNIFSQYKRPELKLTKAFLTTLEHCNTNVLKNYLCQFNKKYKKIRIKNAQYDQEVPLNSLGKIKSGQHNELQEGGYIDGTIRTKDLVIYIESKKGTKLKKRQLKKYLNKLKEEKYRKKIFLIITDLEEDAKKLEMEWDYGRIGFFYDTWDRIYEFCKNTSRKLRKRNREKYSVDIFLLNQLSEFLKLEGVIPFTGFTKKQIEKLEKKDLSIPENYMMTL